MNDIGLIGISNKKDTAAWAREKTALQFFRIVLNCERDTRPVRTETA
jgi:hypothetical protein